MTTLIAGGGLAGAAAACLLGRDAVLIEREPVAHDKVCGEFVSWEAQDRLVGLGLDLDGLGGAPIHTVRLVHGRSSAAARLPGVGLGLTRRALDEAVLATAVRRGATVIRGHAVRHLTERGLEVSGLGPMEGDRVLLATGKHDLRSAPRRADAGPLIGLKMLYELAPAAAAALAGHVEVVLFPGGYAGLQPVEGGRANLCLLIDRGVFRDVGGTWAGVAGHLVASSPHLAARLAGAEATLDRPLAVARIPYGFVHAPAAGDRADMFRMGDQLAVIPSFAGDGMAIALHTAFAAAGAADAGAYHRRMRAGLRRQVGGAMVLHRLGQSHPGLVTAFARLCPPALAWVAALTRVRGGATPRV